MPLYMFIERISLSPCVNVALGRKWRTYAANGKKRIGYSCVNGCICVYGCPYFRYVCMYTCMWMRACVRARAFVWGHLYVLFFPVRHYFQQYWTVCTSFELCEHTLNAYGLQVLLFSPLNISSQRRPIAYILHIRLCISPNMLCHCYPTNYINNSLSRFFQF